MTILLLLICEAADQLAAQDLRVLEAPHQFQEKLSLLPSLLLSPLASLCFVLYATRSCSVKPSCATMKLMHWSGRLHQSRM